MSIARLVYLTTPAGGRYVLNFELFGSEELISIEVSRHHLEDLLINGIDLIVREGSRRVPSSSTERDYERTVRT